VACATGRKLIFLNAEDGNIFSKTSFPMGIGREYDMSGINNITGSVYTCPVIDDKQVYVFCSDGRLWAIEK